VNTSNRRTGSSLDFSVSSEIDICPSPLSSFNIVNLTLIRKVGARQRLPVIGKFLQSVDDASRAKHLVARFHTAPGQRE
jgi:hypothetical protein